MTADAFILEAVSAAEAVVQRMSGGLLRPDYRVPWTPPRHHGDHVRTAIVECPHALGDHRCQLGLVTPPRPDLVIECPRCGSWIAFTRPAVT